MIVHVELISNVLAEVTVELPWWRRWIIREQVEARMAVLAGGDWCWDRGGRAVPSPIAAALSAAVVVSARLRRIRRGDHTPAN